MTAKFDKSRLPSRHVSVGPERVPHPSYYYAMGLTEEDYRFIETQDSKDYADNMQQFIDNGYNAIVTVGFALGDATTAAAKENPGIFFIGVDQFQGEALPNLTGLIFHEDQSGYLAGVLAARMTKSGTIAG